MHKYAHILYVFAYVFTMFAASPSLIMEAAFGPQPFWDHPGVTLGSHWDHAGIILGPCWHHFGTIVVSTTHENNKHKQMKRRQNLHQKTSSQCCLYVLQEEAVRASVLPAWSAHSKTLREHCKVLQKHKVSQGCGLH